MPIFILFGTGVYLGLYFNVAALVCLSGIAAATFTFTSPAQSLTEITWPLVLCGTALQLGYFVGLIARDFAKGAPLQSKQSQSNRVY